MKRVYDDVPLAGCRYSPTGDHRGSSKKENWGQVYFVSIINKGSGVASSIVNLKVEVSSVRCGLARPRSLVGEKPTQVAVSHGPGIQPCRCSSNPAYQRDLMRRQ